MRHRERSDEFEKVVLSKLKTIENLLRQVIRKENQMSKELDDLTAAVAAEDTVIDSAVALIQGFSAQLAAAGTDPAKLTALKADIDAKTQALASAVAANTAPPAAPAP